MNELAQAFEVLAGPEYKSPGGKRYVNVNLILASGFITPLNPKDTIEVFNVPAGDASFVAQFPHASGKSFIAFTQPDRNRFFRQGYVGFRLKTSYVADPGTFYVAWGVNESVTRGKLRAGVIRLDGYFPLPLGNGKYLGIFGSALVRPETSFSTTPLLLTPATGVQVPGPNVAIVTRPTVDRDYYRAGIALNLIETVTMLKQNIHVGH